jgi:hypothetical protein
VGAVARVEAVDVERDPDARGERGDDLVGDAGEGLAAELAALHLAVGEGADAVALRLAVVGLFFAHVADADLHELLDLGHLFEHVPHDRGVGVGEPLVRVAGVGVGVDVEHAEGRPGLGEGLESPERDRVVTPDETQDFSLREHVRRGLVDGVVHLDRQLVHPRERGEQLGVFARVAAVVDDRLRARLALFVPDGDLGRGFEHDDAREVRAVHVEVVEVDLLRRLEDGGRALGRAAAVRGGRLPGNGQDPELGLGGRVREAEDAGVTGRGRVRVEGHGAHSGKDVPREQEKTSSGAPRDERSHPEGERSAGGRGGRADPPEKAHDPLMGPFLRKLLVALPLFAGTVMTVPHRLAGWEADAHFEGDTAVQERLARGLRDTTGEDLVSHPFRTGSAHFDSEWLFGTYMMAGMGFGQLALAHPEREPELVADMDRCIDGMMSDAAKAYDRTTWGEDPLAETTLEGARGHVAYLGYLNLVLGMLRRRSIRRTATRP